MAAPLVSIVVPIYNVEIYFSEFLDSVFSQTYENIEYIFVNDNTPDNSVLILEKKIKEYKKNNCCKLINNNNNVGLAGCRIIGLKQAIGEYVVIADSDDKLSITAVEKMVYCAIATNADIVESNFYYWAGDKLTECFRIDNNDVIYNVCKLLSLTTPVALWGKLYKRRLFMNVDSLFIVGSLNIEDYYASPLLYERAKNIRKIDDFTYFYRIDNQQSGSKGRRWNKIENLVMAVRKHEDHFCAGEGEVYRQAINEAKYRIITCYYPVYKRKERKKMIKLFPEIKGYVKEKPILERIVWFLILHDYYYSYLLVNKIRGI